MAVMLACSPARSGAPEVCALYDAASAIVRAWWADVAAQARVGTPEPLPTGRARVDAILATLDGGLDLRENILAAEVLRLREQWDALRARVARETSATDNLGNAGQVRWFTLGAVLKWMDDDAEVGGA